MWLKTGDVLKKIDDVYEIRREVNIIIFEVEKTNFIITENTEEDAIELFEEIVERIKLERNVIDIEGIKKYCATRSLFYE